MKKCRKIYACRWLRCLILTPGYSVCVRLAVNADLKAILGDNKLESPPISTPKSTSKATHTHSRVCVWQHIELTANETAANGEGVGSLCQAMCRVLASKIQSNARECLQQLGERWSDRGATWRPWQPFVWLVECVCSTQKLIRDP